MIGDAIGLLVAIILIPVFVVGLIVILVASLINAALEVVTIATEN